MSKFNRLVKEERREVQGGEEEHAAMTVSSSKRWALSLAK